jgi:hypothetical protein
MVRKMIITEGRCERGDLVGQQLLLFYKFKGPPGIPDPKEALFLTT